MPNPISKVEEKLRKEWNKNYDALFYYSGFDYIPDVEIADWWLSKFTAYRQELIKWAEGEKKQVKLEGEVYNPLDSDPACVHGFNSALDQLTDKLKKG